MILIEITCITCGVLFGITDGFQTRRKVDHGTWYCPNGHQHYYPQQTKEDNLRTQVKKNEIELADLKSARTRLEERCLASERSRNAYKGALTKCRRNK